MRTTLISTGTFVLGYLTCWAGSVIAPRVLRSYFETDFAKERHGITEPHPSDLFGRRDELAARRSAAFSD